VRCSEVTSEIRCSEVRLGEVRCGEVRLRCGELDGDGLVRLYNSTFELTSPHLTTSLHRILYLPDPTFGLIYDRRSEDCPLDMHFVLGITKPVYLS